MKRFIKIASLMLAVVMTLAMLTACSGGGGGGGGSGNTGGNTGGSTSGGSGTGGSGDNTGGSTGGDTGGDSGGGSTDEPDAGEGVSIQWKNSLLSKVYSGNDNIAQGKFTGLDTHTATPTSFKAMWGTEGVTFVAYMSGREGIYIISQDMTDDDTLTIWKIDESNKYTEVPIDGGLPQEYCKLYSLCYGPEQKYNATVTTKWETYKNTKYYTEHAVILDDAGVIDCVYFYPTNTRADVKLVKLRQGSGNWVYLENMDVREGTTEISSATSQNIFDRTERQLMNLENYEPKENGGTGGDKPEATEKEVSWADSRLGSIYSMADRSNVKFYGINSNTGKQEIFLGGRNNSLSKTVGYWDVDAGRYQVISDRKASGTIELRKINSQNQYILRTDDISEFTNANQIWGWRDIASGPFKEYNTTVTQSRENYNGVEYYTEKAKVESDDGGFKDCTYYYTSDAAANLSDVEMIKVEESGQKTYYLTNLTIEMSSTPIDATIGNIFTAQERKWLDPSNYTHVGGSSTGGDGDKEEEVKETTIPWSQSRTSKVYYMDDPRNGGAKSIKLYGTNSRTGKRGEYAWVTHPEVQKLVEYYSDGNQKYLWLCDWKTREKEWWKLDGNTYTAISKYDGPGGLETAEDLSVGPAQAQNPTVISAIRTYRSKEYYTETAYITTYEQKLKCTYYYPVSGLDMNTIQVIKIERGEGEPIYLIDVDARISNEYVNSEKSIFTKKQQEALDPRNYTEAKE